MKKTVNLILIIMLIFFFGSSIYLFRENQMVKDETQTTYSPVYLTTNSLTPETFYEKINNNDKFIAYIGRPTCPDCSLMDEYFLEAIATNGLETKVYYVNVTSIYEESDKVWGEFKKDLQIEGVPTYIYFENGKAVDYLDYEAENHFTPNELFEWFEKVATYF